MIFNISTSDGSSTPDSGSTNFSTPPSSWSSWSSWSPTGTLNMATSLAYSSSSRTQPSAKALLPSVLAPNRSKAMPLLDAIDYISELLNLNLHRQPQPRTITIVFYDIRGRLLIVNNLDDFRLEEPATLEFFVTLLQSMLDGKTDGRQLLVSRFEFRSQIPRLPPIMGKLGGLSKTGNADWVMWPAEGTSERHYFNLYQHLLLRGISVNAEKPILKVRTVEFSGDDHMVAAGHLFGEWPKEENVDTKGKELEIPLSGQYAALGLSPKLQAKLPVDLNFDAPEFKLMARFMDELKMDRRADLADVYGQHLMDGQQPIKGLLLQGKKGYSGTNPRHPKQFLWIGPEHPAYNTIKPRATEAKEVTTDSRVQEAGEKYIGGDKQFGPYGKRESAAYWFEDIDDETYFPAAGKGTSAALTGTQPVPDNVSVPINISKRAVHGRAKSRAETMNAVMNLKVLTHSQKTVATPSGTSPTHTIRTLYNSSKKSPQVSAANTPTLQPPNIIRTGSPLKQSTPTTSQLRAESPAFTFDSKSRLTNNAPAVADLLRLIQKEGVTAATSQKTSAESAGEPGAPTCLPLQNTVASPSPLYTGTQIPVPEANASRASPSYNAKLIQSASHALDAVISMTAQVQPQISPAGTIPATQHPNWYTTLQAQTAAPAQNLPHPPASRGLRPATSRSSLNRHQTVPQRFPSNIGYYNTSGTSTPSSHNLVSGTTTLSFPTVAHPQPQTSAMAANAFKEYQAQFDKESQVGASTSEKENTGAGGPSDSKGFQFVFGNFSQQRRIKSPKSRK